MTGKPLARATRAPRRDCRDPVGDPPLERRVRRLEHATGQDDIRIRLDETQPSDDGHGHRDQLVRQPVDDPLGDRVTIGGGPEDDRRQMPKVGQAELPMLERVA